MKERVLVVGCGVGGPAMAMALQHVGIESTIVEAELRDAAPRGTFLNVASNGLDALAALGLHRRVADAGFPTPRMRLLSGRGRLLGEVSNGIELEDGTVSVTIERGALHRVLRDEAERRGIVIERGRALLGVDDVEDGALAHFADGSSMRASSIIGADGVHGVTRRIVDARAPSPRYTGLVSVGGVARSPDIEETPGAYQMIFGTRAFFGWSTPRRGETYWFANVGDPARTTARATELDDPAPWRARLASLFAGDEGPMPAAIASTERLVAYPIFDLPKVPRWHRGALVLIGDAAHATSPSSGQGASLALEDAIVLACALRDQPSREAAFASFVRTRRPRVERVIRESAAIGGAKVPGPIGRFFRDLFMPWALATFATPASQAWLHAHHVSWGSPTPTERAGAPRVAPENVPR